MPNIKQTCEHCRAVFLARASDVNRGRNRYCSHACAYADRTRPLADRFWEKVNKTDTCWLWQGAVHRKAEWPYGLIGSGGRQGKTLEVHRVSWELHYGPIPANTQILHHCDVTLCVRPEHLFLGSQLHNMVDMVLKGRQSLQKLTPEQVREIRARSKSGISRVALGREYGVTGEHINNIVRNRTWRHLT